MAYASVCMTNGLGRNLKDSSAFIVHGWKSSILTSLGCRPEAGSGSRLIVVSNLQRSRAQVDHWGGLIRKLRQ